MMMVRPWVATCVLLGLLGMPHATGQVSRAQLSVSPVQKVIELLDDLKAKVQSDLDAEGAAMEEYTTWCDNAISEKGYALKTAKREIADLVATMEDAKATIAAMDAEVEESSVAISGKEKELAAAVADRAATARNFKATEKELVDTVDELAGARVQLKKELGLVQKGNKKTTADADTIKKVQVALGHIVSSARIQAEKRAALQGFLQAAEGDDLSLRQPQGQTEAYGGHSDAITGTVEDMQAKAEGSLSEARKNEMKSKHEFQMLQMSLEGEVKHLKKALASAIATKGQAGQDASKAQAEKAAVEKSKAADEQMKAETERECRDKADAWAERQKEAADEMGAIAKAKEILSTGVKALVQMGVRTREVGSLETSDVSMAQAAKRARLVKKLKELAQRYHSFNLMQVSSTASADPFGKIRSLIEDMVEKLMNEASEEATHKAFCDKELAESTSVREQKMSKLDKFQARMDKATTNAAELEGAVKNLQAEVSKTDAELAEATAIRSKENEEYLKASKDFADSQHAVAQATSVLRDYYAGAFIQVKVASKKAGSKQPSFGGAQKDAGGSIISIMEVAESDFARLLAEAENDESVSAKAFEELSQETKVSRAAKEAEMNGKNSEIKSLKVSLMHYKEDHGTVAKELDAVMDYLEKLKPECETKVMSYEERKQSRDNEIEGLREALAILAGEDVAASALL